MIAGPLLGLMLASACEDVLVPLELPAGSREFVPEPVFKVWWQQIEICSGRQASFDAVSWYVIPGETPFRIPNHDYDVVGFWDQVANRIVLLEILPDRRAPYVRHEALHAILRRTDHPDEFFVTRCGEVINGPESPG